VWREAVREVTAVGRTSSPSADVRRDDGHTRVVKGRLMMADFADTDYQCRVHPAAGAPIRCTFGEEHRATVLAALTHQVQVEGRMTERDDNGAALRIDRIEPVAAQPDDTNGSFTQPFDAELSLAELAARQGVEPLRSIADLRMETWPEDESVDDLVAAVRAWRDEDAQRERT